MKKIGRCFLSVVLLSSCQNAVTSMENRKLVLKDSDRQVCSLGKLGTKPTYGVNYLPKGYWGNDIQTGTFEIGGKAGDPYHDTLPDLYFSELDDDRPTGFYLFMSFKTNPMRFDENKEQFMLGLEMTIVDVDGTILTKNTYRHARRLSDNFHDNGTCAVGTISGDVFRTVESIFYDSKSLFVSFSLEKGQKIRSLKYRYGDRPMELVNAGLTLSQAKENELALLSYQGGDCHDLDYTQNVGCNPVYRLKSQYGSVYSIDYLKNAFLAKDRYDGSERHPDIIEDPEDYFTEGMSAPIGKEYTVRFGSEDSQGNRSYITFYFVVVDEKGPSLSLLSDKEIITSYTTDIQSENFLSTHFSISDNYDTELVNRVTLEDGKELPEKKIGTFACQLISLDHSENQSKLPFSLTLIDDVAPVLTSSQDELNLTPFSSYNKEKLLGMFQAEDEIDGATPISVVEDTYSENRDIVGNYRFTVETEDRSGNKAKKSIIVRVQDTEGPVFYAKKSFITASKDNIPSVETIISSLIRQEVIPDKAYVKWTILQGEEINSELSLGIHEFSLLLETADEETERVNLTMNIVDSQEMKKDTESVGFWEKICLFFQRLWKKIVSFFAK